MGKQRLILCCYDSETRKYASWYSLNPYEDANEQPMKLNPFTESPFLKDQDQDQDQVYNFSSVVLGSKFYLMGGVVEDSYGKREVTSSVYSYDLKLLDESDESTLPDAELDILKLLDESDGNWVKQAPMLAPRLLPLLIPYEGEVFVIGKTGPRQYTPLPFVELYHGGGSLAVMDDFEEVSRPFSLPLYGTVIREDDGQSSIMWTDSIKVYSINPTTLSVDIKDFGGGEILEFGDHGEWLAAGKVFYTLKELYEDNAPVWAVYAYDWTKHSFLSGPIVKLNAEDRKYFLVELEGYSFGIVACRFIGYPSCQISVLGYNHVEKTLPLQPSFTSPTFIVDALPEHCL